MYNVIVDSLYLQELIDIATGIFNSADYQFKKRGSGLFAKATDRVKEICHNFADQLEPNIEWEFELFKSTNPTGLHNDVNYDKYLNKTCRKVMILPLVWKEAMNPSTIVFNERYSSGKVFQGIIPGTLIDAVTKETVPSNLSSEFLLTDEVYDKWLSHCTKTSMTGLTIKSIEMWKSGKAMIFDSDLLHASGNFDGKNGEWKICVLALGLEERL